MQIFALVIFSAPFASLGEGNPVKTGDGKEILTPAPGAIPHINGPQVYGCRPGHPFLY